MQPGVAVAVGVLVPVVVAVAATVAVAVGVVEGSRLAEVEAGSRTTGRSPRKGQKHRSPSMPRT
jgi:hypothetical protein